MTSDADRQLLANQLSIFTSLIQEHGVHHEKVKAFLNDYDKEEDFQKLAGLVIYLYDGYDDLKLINIDTDPPFQEDAWIVVLKEKSGPSLAKTNQTFYLSEEEALEALKRKRKLGDYFEVRRLLVTFKV